MNEMKKMVWLDMDGTIAQLYKGEWLAKLIAEDVAPYAEADPMMDEADLQALLDAGYTLGIISWTSKNGSTEYNKAVRKTKIEWLRRNYPTIEFEHIHIVKYGTPKYKFMTSPFDVLIDDEEHNRNEWKGVAYAPFLF